MTTTTASRLSDGELVAEVARLAGCEREASASLVAHLAELYGRRLHERAGYASLYTYCTDALRLSEDEAYDRMRAAKVARRYPVVLGLLASGRVNLTTVRLLAPHLTRQNHEELLAAACGKRKRQVQELLAARFPQPDVACSIRKLPARSMEPMLGVAPGGTSPTAASGERVASAAEQILAAPIPSGSSGPFSSPPPPLVQPLSPDRYRVTFTASSETCERLEMARDLLRHAIPSGDPAQIVGRALQVLVEDLVRRKFAVGRRPRASQGQADESRNIPAEVQRAVFIRDHGRCAFVGTHGRRCGERAFVEFHHLIPYAAGCRTTVENLALRCHAHNAYDAEVFYGPIEAARVVDDTFRSRTTTQDKASARAMRQPVVSGSP
jgi:hypothetical protein